MFRSALGVLVAFFALLVATPHTLAQPPAPAKKQVQKKQVQKKQVQKKALPKRKTTAKRRSATPTALKANEKVVRKGVVVRGKRHVTYERLAPPAVAAAAPVMTVGDMAGLNATRDPLALHSNVALVMDQASSRVLFEKNSAVPLPIASLTKLMTALIVVEAQQDLDEVLVVTSDDIDREKNSASRLRVGTRMTREDMLHIALMSSENRAASALGRNYPGGLPGFVAAMNAKAKALGMWSTHFVDSTGLSSNNVATATDLAKLVVAAHRHPMIRQYSTSPKHAVRAGRGSLQYVNSNRLVMRDDWEIGLQKTGYITEAGRCLVMQANIEDRPVVMVFLDSKGKESRLGDAGRIRRWLESGKGQPLSPPVVTHASAKQS